jgi:hypothetical protein
MQVRRRQGGHKKLATGTSGYVSNHPNLEYDLEVAFFSDERITLSPPYDSTSMTSPEDPGGFDCGCFVGGDAWREGPDGLPSGIEIECHEIDGAKCTWHRSSLSRLSR